MYSNHFGKQREKNEDAFLNHFSLEALFGCPKHNHISQSKDRRGDNNPK